MRFIKNILFLVSLLLANGFWAQSVGGTTSGSASYCDTLNSGFISVTGQTGIVVNWQYSINGGVTWINNSNTFTSQSYFNLKKSTCYRAIIKNGSFPADTSTIACVTIYNPSDGGSISGAGEFCNNSGSGALNLVGNIGNVIKWQSSINGGATWSNISNTTTSLVYSNITQNTSYRAIVQNSSFCKMDTSTITSFTINPTSFAGAISSVGSNTVCYAINSKTISLSGNVGNIIDWIYTINNGLSWNSSSNNTNSISISNLTQSTWYGAIVQSGNCPIDTSTLTKITVLPQFTVNAGKDTTIQQGQSTTLTGAGNGTPNWSPLSSNITSPNSFTTVVSPPNTTYFILTVTDVNACSNFDSVLITVVPLKFDGKITNVFSPNGDGINDNWYIEGIASYQDNEVVVYNIYGQEVYRKKKYTNDWQGTYNGSQLPDGTYFYIIKVNESSEVIKGSVDILRNK